MTCAFCSDDASTLLTVSKGQNSMSAVIIDYRVDVCRITKGAHMEHL